MADKKQSTELTIMQPLINASQALTVVAQLQGFVKDLLKPEYDYGVIPGTQKNTLLKPGAEKLNKVYGFVPRDILIASSVEDWEKEPALFDYTVKTILVDREDNIVGIGLGSCNSWESKYKYRNAARLCPSCGKDALCRSKFEDKATKDKGWYCYDKKGGCGAKFHSAAPEIANQEVGKVENPDIADVKNTVLKMAKKRSLIDATINATMSSDLFTQDVEDFESFNVSVAPDGTEPDAKVTAEPVDEKKSSTTSNSSTKQTSPSTNSNTARTSTQSATTGQKPPVTTADKTPGQTGNATQASEKKPVVEGPEPAQNAAPASTPTTSTGASDAVKSALITAQTLLDANEGSLPMPPAAATPVLVDLFKAKYPEDATARIGKFMWDKHGVNKTTKAEKFTWDVYKDAMKFIAEG